MLAKVLSFMLIASYIAEKNVKIINFQTLPSYSKTVEKSIVKLNWVTKLIVVPHTVLCFNSDILKNWFHLIGFLFINSGPRHAAESPMSVVTIPAIYV